MVGFPIGLIPAANELAHMEVSMEACVLWLVLVSHLIAG